MVNELSAYDRAYPIFFFCGIYSQVLSVRRAALGTKQIAPAETMLGKS